MAQNPTIKHANFVAEPMGNKAADLIPGIGHVILAFLRREFDIPEEDEVAQPTASEVYGRFLDWVDPAHDRVQLVRVGDDAQEYMPMRQLQYDELDVSRAGVNNRVMPEFIAWLGGNGRNHYYQHALKAFNCLVQYHLNFNEQNN